MRMPKVGLTLFMQTQTTFASAHIETVAKQAFFPLVRRFAVSPVRLCLCRTNSKMWMAQDAAIHNYTDKVGSAIADKNLIVGKYSTFRDKLQVFYTKIYNFNTVRADIKH